MADYVCPDLLDVRTLVLDASQEICENLFESLGYARSDNPMTLDEACGSGFFCDIAPQHLLKNLHGIDIDRDAIEKARQKFEGNFQVGDMKNLPFPDNYFDLVVGINALDAEHDTEKVLGEAKRVLKPGKWYVHLTDARNNVHLWKRNQYKEGIKIVPAYIGFMQGVLPVVSMAEYTQVGRRYVPYQICIFSLDSVRGDVSELTTKLQDPDITTQEGIALYQRLLRNLTRYDVKSIKDFFVEDTLAMMKQVGFQDVEHRFEDKMVVGKIRGPGLRTKNANVFIYREGAYQDNKIPNDKYESDDIVLKPTECIQASAMHILIGRK